MALPIPELALDDCGAILGRRGAGKSGAGRALFEHELDAGHRCCAIDPKGDWWGIRMDKDGKSSGFDIPIFGGALIAAHPNAIDSNHLARNSGYSPNSTSFEKARGQLRGLGLAEYPAPGQTRAEGWLFPTGGKR